jgi:predicted transcriptional regulator
MRSQRLHRERIYIFKDIILKLVEYGQLNETALISSCGLNFKKHSPILDKLESRGLISKIRTLVGRKPVTIYKSTQQGIEFSRKILEPYEIMFPRTDTILIQNPHYLLILI